MFELRPYQSKAIDDILNAMKAKTLKGVCVIPTGCHEKGYKVFKHDGNLVRVEDVKVGDKLMGDDGSSRNVLQLHNGHSKMYRITLKGQKISFVVNEDHILHLVRTTVKENEERNYPERINVSVKDYLKLDKTRKHLYKILRTGFSTQSKVDTWIDPYFLGLWLGDGDKNRLSITTPDIEVVEYLKKYADSLGLIAVPRKYKDSNAYRVAIKKTQGKYNKLLDEMRRINLINNKHIPYEFRKADNEFKARFLSGFIDSDGHKLKNSATFEISQKNKNIAYGIYLITGSLGLCPFFREKKSVCYNCEDKTPRLNYRVNFHLDSELYMKVDRKKYKGNNRNRRVEVYGFDVEDVGQGEYFGFTTDGNHLYVDENFIVQHNCGKSHVIAELANALGGKILVCQPNKELLEQNLEKYEMLTDEKPSVYCAGLERKETDGDVIFATIQSVTRNKQLFKNKIDLVIQDECHTYTNGTVFASFLKDIDVKKVIGMTATPVYLTNTLQGAMLKMINRVQKGFYSKIIHVTQLEDVVDKYWAPLKYITPREFDGRYLQLNSSGSDYTETSMKRAYEYNETHKEILSVISKMAIKSSIIFVPSIEEAEELESMSKDIKALSSKTKAKDRKRIIEDFKSGKVKHIANCNILAIGFNYPELETVIMARPTNSLAVYYQQLGRVCRPFPGKEEAKIIDLTGNIKKFGEISKLRFEEVKPYGWGMFNGDILLTRIPLSDLERGDFIRKQDLVSGINPMKIDAEVFMDSKYGSRKQVNNKDNRDPNIMYFGKHKGKTIDEIYMKDLGYLKWMLNNPDWDWSNMIETKNIIQEKFANY